MFYNIWDLDFNSSPDVLVIDVPLNVLCVSATSHPLLIFFELKCQQLQCVILPVVKKDIFA